MRRLADLNGKKHFGAPVFVMPACTIHQKHDNLQGSGDARKPIDLETQKREADIPASPIRLPSRSNCMADHMTIAGYLTIDCVEYSDAGSLPTLPRSST